MQLWKDHLNDLAQDCGNTIATALELPQSYTKSFIASNHIHIKLWD